MHLAATCKLALLSCSNHNRRNLAEQAEDIVVQLARGLALQLGYAVTPSTIAATGIRGTGPCLPSRHVPNTRSCCEG